MIYGIGTDIVSVPRIRSNLDRFGKRFAWRILNEVELEEFLKSYQRAHFLAKRFAAKEATAKAMGLGFRAGMSLRNIAISNNEYGKPTIKFAGRANELVCELGIGEGFVSLSDEQDYAIAFVMLMKKKQK